MRTMSDAADRPNKMTEKGALNLATWQSLATLKSSFSGVWGQRELEKKNWKYQYGQNS